MKTLKAGLTLSFLAMLCACSITEPRVVTRTVTTTTPVFLVPPANLIAPCIKPSFNIKTNADLLSYTVALESQIERCNASMTRLSEWATEHGSP